MMKNTARFLFLVLLTISTPINAREKRVVSPDMIEKAETYLQELSTAQANFVQTTHLGDKLSGTFYLQRPGRLRFEYDGLEDFVVADGVQIHYYDSALEEHNSAPIFTTLAHFFLRKNFSLTDDLIVKDARYGGGLLLLQVVKADEPDAGSITFAFSEEPFELKKWRVKDAQQQITEVELFELNTGMKHDPRLFVYKDPNDKGGNSGYNE